MTRPFTFMPPWSVTYTISPRSPSARRSSKVGVATCAMLGTAPAATSTPARTTVIKARLVDIPPTLGCTLLLSRLRMEQCGLQFQGRAPQTLKCQGFIPIASGAPAATDENVDVGRNVAKTAC
jgi:hypothetical protein